MTKYYNKLYRNHVAMKPELAVAHDISKVEGSGSSVYGLLIDNVSTAATFNCLFTCLLAPMDAEQMSDSVGNMVRSCIDVMSSGVLVKEMLKNESISMDTIAWLMTNRDDVMLLNPVCPPIAVRRMLMLNLLLNEDHTDEDESWDDWDFLSKYRVPTYVIDHLVGLITIIRAQYGAMWNKVVHAAKVSLCSLIDAYAIQQSSLFHDIDKTDSLAELHGPRIAGHHSLEADYTLAKFVEAANDIAITTEVKGYPCRIPIVDGLREAVEYCLGLPKHELGSVPFIALFRGPDFQTLSRLNDLHHDNPNADLEDVYAIIEKTITNKD